MGERGGNFRRILSMKTRFLLIASLLLSSLATGQEVSFDDIARFIAAKPVSATSPLYQSLNRPAVRQHYIETDKLSTDWQERRLKAIKQWAVQEIQPKLKRPQCVKYMFGGPDFVHVATVFPGVPEYVLVGLEPLGTLPNFFTMDEPSLENYLKHFNYTLRSISRRNFSSPRK